MAYPPPPEPASGSGIDEVRFDGNSIGRQTAFDKFAARELGEREVAIDHLGPGLHRAVYSEHCGYHRTGQPALAVAAVEHARPGNRLAQAVFTHTVVAEQEGIRTEQSIIAQRLNDRHRFFSSCVIRCW